MIKIARGRWALCLGVMLIVLAIVNTRATSAATPDKSTYYSSLYGSGVDDDGNKLGVGVADPHWKIVAFLHKKTVKATKKTKAVYSCMRFQIHGDKDSVVSGKIKSNRTGLDIPATTVYEKDYAFGKGEGAGLYVAPGDLNTITGNTMTTTGHYGESPWGKVSKNARWISINKYALHYANSDCDDLSRKHISERDWDDYFVFETKFEIKGSADEIDYTSIRMALDTNIYVDNIIAMQVNGTIGLPRSVVGSGDLKKAKADKKNGFLMLYQGNKKNQSRIWIEPGFHDGAEAVHNKPGGNFVQGTNTLRIYVKSNYSHMGIMIPKISLDFDFNSAIEVNTKIRKGKKGEFGNSSITALPGDLIQWNHNGRQNGLAATTSVVTFNAVHNRGDTQLLDEEIATWKKGRNPSSTWSVLRNEGTGKANSFYTVGQDDVGKSVCGKTVASRTNNTNSNKKESAAVCANVPYHYPNGVTPTTTADKTTVEAGDSVKFTYKISNSGPTKTKGLGWRAYTFILRGDQSLPTNWNETGQYTATWESDGVGCGGRGVPASKTDSRCAQSASGTGRVILPTDGAVEVGVAQLSTVGSSLPQIGDQICSYLAVNIDWAVNNNASSKKAIGSNIACVKVGKRPQLQINGSDSYATDGFVGAATSSSSAVSDFRMRGSYSQYGLLTNTGQVSRFGSAGYSTAHNDADRSKVLTWANANGASGTGGLTRAISAPNLSSYKFTIKLNNNSSISVREPVSKGSDGVVSYQTSDQQAVNLANLESGVYRFEGTLNVYNQPYPGKNITIFATNGINVVGNIPTRYYYEGVKKIPVINLVALNGDIKVNGEVTKVAANLISANGAVKTCNNFDGKYVGINGNSWCSKKLAIYGSVVSSKSPHFNRTFGAGTTSSTISQSNGNLVSSSSEWVNYVPSNWITPNSEISLTPDAFKTQLVTEVPIRY